MKLNKSEELIQKQKKQAKRKKVIESIKKTIEISSSIANTILMLKEKPKAWDYASVGISLANVALKVQKEIAHLSDLDPRTFFDPAEHYLIPFSLRKAILSLASGTTILIESGKNRLIRGFILDHEVYWVERDNIKENPFCKLSSKDKIIEAIGDILWKHVDSDNVLFSKAGLLEASDESLNFDFVETKSLKTVEKRISMFMDDETPRAYLLEGPPGTGKSSAVMYLINKLGLKSLRTTLGHLAMGSNSYGEESYTSLNLEMLLRALRPDLIIIDDIDRSYHVREEEMLKIFEVMRKYCRVIVATCNNKNYMIGAMLRVGRFDDLFTIKYIDVEVVKELLDEDDHDLAERFTKWPIAYIQNYKTVKRVMGKKQARSELDDIEARILQIEKKTNTNEKASGINIKAVEEEED